MKVSDLQTSIAATLSELPELAGVPVLTERRGDLANEVEIAISKIGLAIIVLTPVMKNDQPESPAINLATQVIVQISENPAINLSAAGTNQPAVDLALVIAQALHHTFPALGFGYINFEGAELLEETPNLVYQVIFSTRTALR